MNSNSTVTSFWAGFLGDQYMVRVTGPGICRESGRFENLLLDVEGRHPSRLLIDLSECPRLDSTFAGAFLRLADRADKGGYRVMLAGAHDQVQELLDTLCLGDVFETMPIPDASDLRALAIEDRGMSKEQVMELSLDGHERLAARNEENLRRFGPLMQVMREQLARNNPSH